MDSKSKCKKKEKKMEVKMKSFRKYWKILEKEVFNAILESEGK